jgi:hypothetical protein
MLDCPFPPLACPTGKDVGSGSGATCSGHGLCATGAGICACFPGYVGDACGECDVRHVALGQHCVWLPASNATCTDGVVNGNEQGIDCGGFNCRECGSALTQIWLRPVVMGLAGLAIILSVCVVRW